jgi:AcrR family transcriptional regulator
MAQRRSTRAAQRDAEVAPVAKPSKSHKENRKAAAKEKPSPKLRLLKAATHEFAERGFAGARIDGIAKRAQLNKQLIYHYFGNKQQLYAAVLTDMVRRLQTDNAAAHDGDYEPNHNLELQLQLLKVVRKPVGRQWVRLLMFEALEGSSAIHLEDARRRVYEGGVHAVEAAQEVGEIDPALDAKMLRMALFGLTLVPSLLPQIVKMMTGLDQKSPEFTEGWSKLLSDIYAGLAPAKSGDPSGR